MNTPPRAAAPATGREIVVGTRGSALALVQTTLVCDALRRAHPGITIRIERITTTGDVRSDVPLVQLGRGMFVKEIESALIGGQIDLAVHSAKDLPSILAPELTLGALQPRADARDVVVSRYGTLQELPPGARVGTSSPRRACQLRALRPDVEPMDIRGNVDTRLRKLASGDFDALLLAAAGLLRLNRESEITEWLDPDTFIPSVGQGALAVEVRVNDEWARELARPLDDARTRAAIVAERAFLAELGAGCRAAVGAYAQIDADDSQSLRIVAFIGSPGGHQVRAVRVGHAARAEMLGREIAHELLLEGGAHVLANESKVLAGKVIATTRPTESAAALIVLLRAHGAVPVACPTIAVKPRRNLAELDELLFGVNPPQWIAFTSVNAVHAVADRLAETGRSLPDRVCLAAVGDATARAAEARFRAPEFLPSVPNADALAAQLPDIAGVTVLVPHGNLAAETLASGLSARGASVQEIVVYDTVPGPGVDALTTLVSSEELHAVVFASPSSIDFAAAAVSDLLRSRDTAPLVICIGPTTARAARRRGLDVIEAESPSVGGIVEAIVRAFAARSFALPLPGVSHG